MATYVGVAVPSFSRPSWGAYPPVGLPSGLPFPPTLPHPPGFATDGSFYRLPALAPSHLLYSYNVCMLPLRGPPCLPLLLLAAPPSRGGCRGLAGACCGSVRLRQRPWFAIRFDLGVFTFLIRPFATCCACRVTPHCRSPFLPHLPGGPSFRLPVFFLPASVSTAVALPLGYGVSVPSFAASLLCCWLFLCLLCLLCASFASFRCLRIVPAYGSVARACSSSVPFRFGLVVSVRLRAPLLFPVCRLPPVGEGLSSMAPPGCGAPAAPTAALYKRAFLFCSLLLRTPPRSLPLGTLRSILRSSFRS